MVEMEVKVDNLYKERLRCLQEHKYAYFEKTLRASHLPALNANPRMTLPALFIQQQCDKIRESVELRNEATGTTWRVQLAVHNPRNITQVLFYGRGWSDFAAANALVEGDRLIFVLRAVSSFGVYIFVKKEAPDERSLTDWRRLETSQTSTDESSRGRKFEDTTAERVRNSFPTLSDVLARKRIVWASENGQVPDSASEVWMKMPLGSPQKSPNCYKQIVQECMSEHLDVKMESRDHARDELPHFLKRLTSNNTVSFIRLEIPSSFVKTHSTRIGAQVIKLQGIEEESPVSDVTSYRSSGRPKRWFLGSGWSKFASDNLLRTGQRLVFILIADSFFVVRNI